MTMALLAVALMLSACGGGTADAGVASLNGDDTTATTTEGGTDTADATDPDDVETAMLAWAECMRAEGVDIEDPTVGPDGNIQLFQPGGGAGGGPGGDPGDREAMSGAFDACSEHLEGLSLGFERTDQTEMQDTMLEFAACMRDNGVDMPDPDFAGFGPGPDDEQGEPGPGGGPFGDIDMQDPDFQAAQETCSDILGGGGNTGEGDSDA